MEDDRVDNPKPVVAAARSAVWLVRVVLVVGIVAGGVKAMQVLAERRNPPKARPPDELIRTVRAIRLEPRTVPLTLSGLGTVRPIRHVDVSTQVPGKVVGVRAELKPGTIVRKGELLFTIESVDFELAVQQADADITRVGAEIATLERQKTDEERRLAVLRRQQELAQSEYGRIKSLLEETDVGAEADVERAESAVRQAEAAVIATEGQLAQIPQRLVALAAQRHRAELVKSQHELNVTRCKVHCPWTGRVTRQTAEEGQYVAPGQTLVSLADDSVVEIPVTLQGSEALTGLGIVDRPAGEYPHWFDIDPIENVRIDWVESRGKPGWLGRVIRVEAFDARTRTLVAAVRPDKPEDKDAGYRLVEGMFCRVTIPGRTLREAIVIPRTAIQLGGNVLALDAELRMTEREITVARVMGNQAVVSYGLAAGELIVATRLSGALNGLTVRAVDAATGEAILSTSRDTPPAE